jgi:hypothetical protein
MVRVRGRPKARGASDQQIEGPGAGVTPNWGGSGRQWRWPRRHAGDCHGPETARSRTQRCLIAVSESHDGLIALGMRSRTIPRDKPKARPMPPLRLSGVSQSHGRLVALLVGRQTIRRDTALPTAPPCSRRYGRDDGRWQMFMSCSIGRLRRQGKGRGRDFEGLDVARPSGPHPARAAYSAADRKVSRIARGRARRLFLALSSR